MWNVVKTALRKKKFLILTQGYVLLILERKGLGGERERDINVGERHGSVASHWHSDPGSDPQPFGVWGDFPTKPPGQGLREKFIAVSVCVRKNVSNQ